MRVYATRYGFMVGDEKGILLKVSRLASSRDGERRRWVAVSVACANGERVEITASPKMCRVSKNWMKP